MKMSKELYVAVFLLVAFIGSVAGQELQEAKRFISLSAAAPEKNTYHIDLTQLNERFQKVYFITELNEHEEIVITDSDLSSSSFSVTARKRYPEEHITAVVNGLKAATERKSALLDSVQKAGWMKRNDKYSKKE